VYQLFASKSGGNCAFYSTHFKFENGGGGHLEIGSALPLLLFLTLARFS
jgi:hypothetical protein